MAYQIKATPFYRRMFSSSKKNGQLDRLREEYERIQEFNDHTIELKMRQVRLKRLFREIEGIKETDGGSKRRPTQVTPTPEQLQHAQRLEALMRAKELGKEISRRNALMSSGFLRSELRTTAKMQAASEASRHAKELRERAARRISYGNAQSKSNIQRLGQRRLRRLIAGNPPAESKAPVSKQNDNDNVNLNLSNPMLSSTSCSLTKEQHPADQKRSMLHQRLHYGNSRSDNNIARLRNAPNSSSLEHDAQNPTEYAQKLLSSITTGTAYCEQTLLRTCTNNLLSFDDSDESVEGDMQTAPLAPERHEMSPTTVSYAGSSKCLLFSNDAMPTTSKKKCMLQLKESNSFSTNEQQLTAYCNTSMQQVKQPCKRAISHWHLIALTLPWCNAFHQNGITCLSQQSSAPVSRQTVACLDSSSYDDARGTSSYTDRGTQATAPEYRHVCMQTDPCQLTTVLTQPPQPQPRPQPNVAAVNAILSKRRQPQLEAT